MSLTKIEWTDYSFSIWNGCYKVSPGCENCYAMEMLDHRFGRAKWGKGEERPVTSPDYWKDPFRWDRKAAREGKRFRVFCSPSSDVFEDSPELEETRLRCFREVITQTENLTWQILTKRPSVMRKFFTDHPELLNQNIHLGISVENQLWHDQRILDLVAIPDVSCRFLSYEPALGPLDIFLNVELFPELHGDPAGGFWHHSTCPSYCEFACGGEHYEGDGIHWVIAGGESGSGARPAEVDWFRAVRDECRERGVAFFFKQWGEHLPVDQAFDSFVPSEKLTWEKLQKRRKVTSPFGSEFWKVGKKRAGNHLDGVQYQEFPEVVS